MSLRKIKFIVGVDGTLSPATVQDGGVQGEHNATEVVFEFSDELHSVLQEKGSEGKLVYRFDGYDGTGAVHRSDTAVLCERSIVYPLEYSLTQHGGLIKIELIITLIKEQYENGKALPDVTDEVIHSEAAKLKLVFSPYSSGDKTQQYADISTLTEIVKENTQRAIKAAEEAKKAQELTEQLSAVLQVGGEYIFDGGDAASIIPGIIVDTDMSDYSNNAVENKIIKAYVDNISEGNFNTLQGQIDDITVRDYIVEQGTDANGWAYRKWASGVSECSIIKSVTKTLTEKSGPFWYSHIEGTDMPFPSGIFIDASPKTFVTVEEARGNAFLTKMSATAANVGRIYLYSWVGSEYELNNCKIHIHAIGRWK